MRVLLPDPVQVLIAMPDLLQLKWLREDSGGLALRLAPGVRGGLGHRCNLALGAGRAFALGHPCLWHGPSVPPEGGKLGQASGVRGRFDSLDLVHASVEFFVLASVIAPGVVERLGRELQSGVRCRACIRTWAPMPVARPTSTCSVHA